MCSSDGLVVDNNLIYTQKKQKFIKHYAMKTYRGVDV
jgi:hypothetical protein